jgi:hypothetical protein
LKNQNKEVYTISVRGETVCNNYNAMTTTWKFQLERYGELELLTPLSDGRQTFVRGIVYETQHYPDFLRLTKGGDFVAVVDPTTVTEEPITVDAPKASTSKRVADTIKE